MKAFTLFVKVLLFVVSFSLEVSVHAAEKAAIEAQPDAVVDLKNIQQEPHDCLKTTATCAIGNLGEAGFELKVGASVVTLDKNASLIRKSNNEVRLIKGMIWIKAHETLSVSSEFGVVQNQTPGDYWVSKSSSALTALAVSTDVEMAPRGSAEKLTVSQGLQNTLGAIGFNGKAATGIPMPIPFKDHVMRWGRLYRGPKKDLEDQVAQFHAKWQAATEAAAEINQALYDRKVASVNEAAQAEAEKKAKIEAENQVYRDMFRKRMLDGR